MKKQEICFVIWPPAMKYSLEIINEVKKEFKFVSYNIFEFKTDWLTLVNSIYLNPIDAITVKRSEKVKTLKKYNKEIGVLRFNVINPDYHYTKKKKVIASVHIFKNRLRKKMLTGLPQYCTFHSTDSTMETQVVLEYLKNKVFLRTIDDRRSI